MNAFIYLVATVFCIGLSVRTFRRAQDVPVRRTFLVFGGLLGLSYLAFALTVIPGLGGLRYVHSVAGAFVPVASLVLVEQLFERVVPPRRGRFRRLAIAMPIAVLAFFVADAGWFRSVPRASPPEVVIFLFVFGAFGLTVEHMLRVRNALVPGPDRVRMTQLTVLAILALVFSALEYVVRAFAPRIDLSSLSIVVRSILIQGAFPPLGATLGTLFVYAAREGIRQGRAPELREILASLLTLAVLALALVLIFGVTVFSTGVLMTYPVHGAFQLFIASLLFVAMYAPLRARVHRWSSEWLNPPGERLDAALQEMGRILPKLLSLGGLEDEVLGRLVASGRVSVASLYLWDEDLGSYRLQLQAGSPAEPLLETVALGAFTERFLEGERTYRLDAPLEQRAAPDNVDARTLVMRAMAAEVTLGLVSGQVVLGWLNLGSDAGAHGWSPLEIRRLEAMADRISVIVENLIGFERLKEQHRLAAIGEMSAGLAHEIRNPLAGIKGAAQYLQGEAIPKELGELVEVIVSEVDRLNVVVSQFLDYARPYVIRPEPTDVGRVLKHVVELVKGEVSSPSVTLDYEVEPGLSEVPLDKDKIVQVLLNLTKNAVQALTDGGVVELRARAGLLRNPGHRGAPALVIAVTDSGPGIAPEVLDKLFIPFVTTKHGGTGLGLAITQRIVEAHGGELGVRSRVGAGTTFTVRLPLTTLTAPLADPIPSVTPPAKG